MTEEEGVLRVELHNESPRASATLSWEIGSLTDGPDGYFCLFDEDGEERLLMRGEELLELQQQMRQAVLDR
jgi:hypothetical protein